MSNLLDTSKRIFHVFKCDAGHLHTGTAIATHGSMTCPNPLCGKPITDVSETEEAQQFYAFARVDLGANQ